MTTFEMLMRCLPFFGFIGVGLYFLFTGLIPAWLDQAWNRWKIYFDNSKGADPNSLWVALGFAKAWKPLAEGDFNEKTAVLLCYGLGTIFILIGMAGIVWIAYFGAGQ